ncbi:MAG TPA: AmmeMemoRadiSam system protein B [Peptococcaceae bacterium]|nr:AmmeMemoRadiSam system protein B [Peptococcaceae bacterium]
MTVVILLFVLMLAAACSEKSAPGQPGSSSGSGKLSPQKSAVSLGIPNHPSFVTRTELHALLAERTTKPPLPAGRIVSAVLPHHLVAGRLLVQAFEVLAQQEPELVVIVGPNHENQGGKVITGLAGWQTPEGLVTVEEDIVRGLLTKGLAVRDEEALSREHSVGALLPLLKHFLPEARIVPLILHHNVSLQEVDNLLQALDPYLQDKGILIASVDFSHYLTRSEAQAKDRETLGYMTKFDYPNLFQLGNDHLDSPASLATAFRLAEKRGLKEFTVLDNTNSGLILQNDYIETTSYFTLVFLEKVKEQN